MNHLKDDPTLIQKKNRTSLHILSQIPNRNDQQIFILKNNQRGSFLTAVRVYHHNKLQNIYKHKQLSKS